MTMILMLLLQQEPPVMKVQVRESAVKEKPSPFAKTVRFVREGDEVRVVEPHALWPKIADGHVSASALVEPRRYISSKTAGTGRGDSTEAYIAAKGWNRDTEAAYKTEKNRHAEFAAVDKIERTSARDLEAKLRAFRESHQLGDYAPR